MEVEVGLKVKEEEDVPPSKLKIVMPEKGQDEAEKEVKEDAALKVAIAEKEENNTSDGAEVAAKTKKEKEEGVKAGEEDVEVKEKEEVKKKKENLPIGILIKD